MSRYREERRIGVLCPNKRFFGAQICSAPFFFNIRRIFPDAKITAVSPTPRIDIISRLGLIDEVLVYDLYAGFRGFVETCRKIRSRKFDILFTLRRKSERDWIFNLFSGAGEKIGFRRKYSHLIYDKCLKYDKKVYRGSNFLNLLSLAVREKADYELIMKDYSPKYPPAVWLIPGSAEKERQWPISNYMEIAKRIIKDSGFNVMFILGPSEKESKGDILRNLDEYSDKVYIGDESLGPVELMGEVRNCIVSLSNNCGPGHVPQVNNKKALVLFNKGTNVYEWINRTAVSEEMISPDDDIASLTVDDVYVRLKQMIDS